MSTIRSVLVLLGEMSFHREIILGISQQQEQRGPWDLVRTRSRNLEHMLSFHQWDGIIAHVADSGLAERLRKLPVPVVNISRKLPETGLPTISTDNRAIGKAAATYFLDKGFLHFAFLEMPDAFFSRERMEGFTTTLKAAGFTPFALTKAALKPIPAGDRVPEAREAWISWLEETEKPVAVFAATDSFAARVNEFCREAGYAVPGKIAILGCDNEPITCLLNHPPRSSIDLGARLLGQRAAELLDQLMAGKPQPANLRDTPPGPVITRQSTDILAVDDPVVREVIRFVEKNLRQPLQVEDLCRAAGLSRRPLEIRLRKQLNRTPLALIHFIRLARARELLVSTHQTIQEIAEHCGYRNAEVFSKTFRQNYGCPPGHYRRESPTAR
ncbi:MAG: substrate-binding domain-containing protein [Opitutales bacterium]|nr:substrate-binding domain-containing protein [Opitutales bacterium]